MDLFNSFHTSDEPEHWIALEPICPASELLPLANFREKLDRTLSDLGNLDYSLKASLEALAGSPAMDTCEHLHVAEMVKPELTRTMSDLADAIAKARRLTDEVIADGVGHRQ